MIGTFAEATEQSTEQPKIEAPEKKAEGDKQLKAEIKFKNDGKGLKGLFK